MNLILLGAPGSGKGTQATKLIKEYGFAHLSTGDIFRQHIANKTELGKVAQGYLDQGQLVPDTLTNDLVAYELEQRAPGRLIFDGFPRTLAQAQALDKILAPHHSQVDAVVYLNVPTTTLVRRLSGRLVCPVCHRTYQRVMFSGDPLCPHDGTKLVRRADDAPHKVRVRLKTYEQDTAPLINYYRQRNLLITINEVPNESADDVFERIVKALNLND